jgi:cytochrome c oxidase subunit 5a
MLRVALRTVPRLSAMRTASRTKQTVMSATSMRLTQQVRLMSADHAASDAEFDTRYEAYFNRADIDGWEIRKGMTELVGMDLVPDPIIVAAALRACRRVNDYALTTRILEIVKIKCADHEKEIWPYMLQELKPTFDELGILTPEEMGYNQPELALPSPYDLH